MKQEFSRRLLVAAAPPRVWDVLLDVPTVASWISIVGDVHEDAPLERYGATLEDRLGPFKLRADLHIEVVDHQPGVSLTARAAGEDRQVASRIAVTATLTTRPASEGTEVQLHGGYEVTGRVATLGASSIRKKGDRMLDEFFAAAARRLGC